MPRQAACLVLGRSASSKLSAQSASGARVFSTTPLRWADDSNNDSSNNKGSSAAERSKSAASAIGSMKSASNPFSFSRDNAFHFENPNENSNKNNSFQRGGGANYNRPRPANGEKLGFPPARVMNLNARPGGNIISLKSLPGRGRGGLGGFRGRGGDSGGDRGSGLRGRFVGREGGFRGGRGDGDRPQFSGRGRGGSGGRGGFVRGRGGRGRGMRGARRGGGRGGRPTSGMEDDEGEDGDMMDLEAENTDEKIEESDLSMDPRELQEAQKQALAQVSKRMNRDESLGVKVAYEPSTTLESLLGWGPAVATNTAYGQAEVAVQGMRVVGGGRAFHENDQSFLKQDINKWRSAGKPIFFSNPEQKLAAYKQTHQTADEWAEPLIENKIKELQERHGTDYESFVAAYEKLDEGRTNDGWPMQIAVQHRLKKIEQGERAQAFAAEKWMGEGRTEKTREAIVKFTIKGDHPEVKYADDIWGRMAAYHAHERSYRPADAAKFEEKIRSVVRS